MKKKNTAKTKLIATIISMVCALSLIAVGVMASLTNFQVAIANQLNLKFDAVEGTLYATRLGDVAGTDRTTSKVLSESTTATDWLKVYDGTTVEGVQNDALTSIQEKIDFISNDGIKEKVNAGTTSIAITYYFYYTLPTDAVSNDVVLTAPAVADGNVAVTYSYVKGTGATLPDFTSGTALTNGETVQVAGGEHLFIKAEAKVDLSKSVKIENADWRFTLNFRISQYTLKGNMLTFNAVSGAETYEVWAKQATTSGASLLAQTSAVGDTDATLGTLVKILDKNTTSVDLDSALGGMEAGKCIVTIIPKNTQGTEITDSRVTVSYNVLPKMTITLTFVFNLNIIPEHTGTVVKAEGVKLIKRDLASIENNHIWHNPDAIAKTIIELICEDMKFKDKQNDPQYLMLSQKVKFKKIKMGKKEKWKKPKLDKAGRSKFYSKYEDRIISLKESNEKVKKDMISHQKNNQILQKVSGMKKFNNEMKKRKEKEESEKKKFLDNIKF